MAKTYSNQAMTGDGGVALIHRRVNEMGFAWHPRGSLDVGIDGHIELRDPATGHALNRLILVQSKASNRDFPGEDDDRFHYVCKPADIDYWLRADNPVILVCSHPDTQEAWWVNVSSWFAIDARRAARRVEFDKHRDRLDEEAAHRLLSLAASELVSPLPLKRDGEMLVSNLMPVTSVPKRLYVAPASVATVEQAQHRLRAHRRRGEDWFLHDRNLLTFRDPRDPPFDVLCDSGVETFDTADWTASADSDQRYGLTRLLNLLLQDMFHRDLRWHGKHRFLYFRPNEDLSDRVVKTTVRGKGRTVVKAYRHRDDPARINQYRHYAIRARFVHLAEGWHLALNPDYHYTSDGFKDSRWADQQRAGIKRMEKNAAVVGLLRFWASYFSPPKTLLDERADDRLAFDDLLRVESNLGFLEPAPRGSSTREADTTTPTLFDVP